MTTQRAPEGPYATGVSCTPPTVQDTIAAAEARTREATIEECARVLGEEAGRILVTAREADAEGWTGGGIRPA